MRVCMRAHVCVCVCVCVSRGVCHKSEQRKHGEFFCWRGVAECVCVHLCVCVCVSHT